VFRRDRRWFTIASIALAGLALLHTLGQLGPPPTDPALASAVAAMRGYAFPFGRMTPTLWDVYRSVQFTMSVLLLSVAALNLALAAAAEVSTALLRRFAALTALGLGALIVIYAYYRVPRPLVTLAAVELLFVLAWLTTPRRASLSAGMQGLARIATRR